MRIGVLYRLGLVVLALTFAAIGNGAARADENGLMHVKIDRGGTSGAARQMSLPLNKAAVIELPADARDVLVSNPKIVDAVIRTPRRVYLLGIKQGQANAFFFDAYGKQILNLEITVAEDTRGLQQTIASLVPGSRVKVEAMRDNIILSGTVPDAGTGDSVVKIAQKFAAKPENVLSLLTIQGKDQVMLKVRIVEMQRTLVKQLGINLSLAGKLSEVAFSLASPAQFALNGRFLGGADPTVGFDYTNPGPTGRNFLGSASTGLRALERVGLIRTLAEPNLTAITGEDANFLAGGEFPVPAGRDRNGNITIEYKKFGVGLGFTPLVVSKGRISLKISTEVSELSTQGALELSSQAVLDDTGKVIGSIAGLTLPALKVRRAETTVELPSGGSLVMAGLIKQETKQSLEGLPGAKDIPVLGALFRSRDFQNDETELVIIVTPYLVDPSKSDALSTPADGYANATDLQTVLFGRINKTYRAPGANTHDKKWEGPVGYALD